jgi:hypothetical protein
LAQGGVAAEATCARMLGRMMLFKSAGKGWPSVMHFAYCCNLASSLESTNLPAKVRASNNLKAPFEYALCVDQHALHAALVEVVQKKCPP